MELQVFLLPKSHHRPTYPWLEGVQGLHCCGHNVLMPQAECISMGMCGLSMAQ